MLTDPALYKTIELRAIELQIHVPKHILMPPDSNSLTSFEVIANEMNRCHSNGPTGSQPMLTKSIQMEELNANEIHINVHELIANKVDISATK